MADLRVSGLGGIPKGNTAQRSTTFPSPQIGDVYYNGQLEILEIYNGTTWVAVSAPPSTPSIATPTDASTGDVYTSTAGKLSVVFTAGSGGGTPSQYNAYTSSGGFSASSSSSTITLTGLTPGTSYAVYGNAQNNFGTTVNTPNSASVTPTTLPEVPTIGTATLNGTDVTVTWTLGNNGGKTLTSIIITPFLNGTTAQSSQIAETISSTSYTFTGNSSLTPGSSYTFKVKTVNANGQSANSTATNSVTIPTSIYASIMVVGGGGGGGFDEGGGAGAGGFRLLTNQTLELGNTYTVTVGNGGPGRSTSSGTGNPGGYSRFIGTGINITASGGGSGASGYGTAPNPGGSGGGYRGSAIAGNAGGYTPVEGYAGGINSRGAGGGGGAGGVGASGSGGDARGPAGGIGAGGTSYTNYEIINDMGAATSSGELSGGNYYFAGGGGAGAIGTFGSGGGFSGLGGGGRGSGSDTGSAQAGVANTGGGGGGASGWGGSNLGAAGGSGIVILRYSSGSAAATSTTGSPTIVSTGGFRYYKFTGDGSITI